jgi:CHASE3 domain sensor protein
MTRRYVPGFTLAVLLLVGIGWLSYRSILDFQRTAERVSRSHQMQIKLQNLLLDLVSAESEARGFVLTGRREYLDLYEFAKKEVQKDLSQLRESPQIQSPQLLQEVLALSELRLERLGITVDKRRQDGLDSVVGEIAGVGKRLMDELRAVAEDLEREEKKLLVDLAAQLERVSQRTTLIIGVGSVVAVLFHLVSLVALVRSFRSRRELERSLLEVSEREQRRIGQDLHDGLCQELTGISLMMGGIQAACPPELLPKISPVVELLNHSIEETRLVIRGLHPVSTEMGGLSAGLRELVDEFSAGEMMVFHANLEECDRSLPLEISSNVYRIAQEALRNTLKHSRGKTVWLTFTRRRPVLELVIEDDGIGMRESAGMTRGFGLGMMRYRASSIGANLRIEPRQPCGTRLILKLPLTEF